MIDNRPTLKEQIEVSKMTDEEIVDLFLPHGFWEKLDFWMCFHCLIIWRLANWNWFNVWTNEKSFVKFAKHGFREWGKSHFSSKEG